MLVVFGANGRTGREVVELAISRGMAVRPVVRDDRDISNLGALGDVQELCYADPEHLDPLRAVLSGATRVISCIDARTAGPGAPIYTGQASENIVRASSEAGAEAILHLSVMGAYRWSYAALNRKSFYLEGGVRNVNAPWSILRVSCCFDEVIEGHMAPPDGGRPWPLKESSRYSPVSRREAAQLALAYLDRIELGRARAVGGPVTYTGPELAAVVAPFSKPGKGRSVYKSLPPGDVSVARDTTRSAVGFVPERRLEDLLSRDDREGRQGPKTVYPVGDPPPHGADLGQQVKALSKAGPDLRRVLHRQLVLDLSRLGVEGASLDFSRAQAGLRWVKAHDGEVAELRGVRVLDASGGEVHRGSVDLLRDQLADEFRVWWVSDEGIPESVWCELDLGVRRRLAADPHFSADSRVLRFVEQNPG